MEITLYVNETEQGPYSLEDVQAMLANGDITKEDFAFFEGCADWVPVADIPGIDDVAEEAAPEEEAWPEEEVAEEEAPAEAAPQAEEAAEIYVWPDGAEDWAGPHTLSAVQAMLAAGGLTDADYAAGFEGAAEGATVADIPGVHDAPVAEEAAEEPVEEEEAAPAPAKKGFKTKGGLAKKGGLSKKGGMKKAGAAKKGGAKGGDPQAVEKGKAKGAAKKAAAAPVEVGDGEISDTSFTKVYILACLLGALGVHRFVSGKTLTGVLMLFTGGGLFIWQLVDIIMILLGKFKDKQGRPVTMHPQEEMSEKKLGTILLIMHFVPVPGIHRFLTGKIGSGVGFLFTLGGLGIWALLDWIKLAQGKFTDKEGLPILHTVS